MNTKQIILDPEFQAVIPPLNADELAGLEASIVADGCRDPLVVWGETLIDGHNRYSICRRLGIAFDVVHREFASRDDALVWMIRNQFARRNLTPFIRAELALKLEPLVAAKAKSQQGTRTDILQKSVEGLNTQKEVARAAGVSHDTIHKAKVLIEAAPEETKAALRSGELRINTAYRAVRQKPAYKVAVGKRGTGLFDPVDRKTFRERIKYLEAELKKSSELVSMVHLRSAWQSLMPFIDRILEKCP